MRFISYDPIIQIDDWDRTEELPTGTREKLTVVQPGTGQYHIFKLPKAQREMQVWSELIASFIAGDLLGWDVQVAKVAVRNGRLGNLLEYVFEPGNTGAGQEEFIEGWRICKERDPDFDVEKGTRHTLPLLFEVCSEILVPKYELCRLEFLDFWGRALAFDTLISNTDRHAENWAVVRGPNGTRMSALYDNGSSLGCGIDSVGLDRNFADGGVVKPSHIDRQKQQGRHHLRSSTPSAKGCYFNDVNIKFLEMYPEGRKWFQAAGSLDLQPVRQIMEDIAHVFDGDIHYSLSERRRLHIFTMLQIGKERIKNILD